MFTKDDLAQCCYCVLLAIQCAVGAHLDVDASEQPTLQGLIESSVVEKHVLQRFCDT